MAPRARLQFFSHAARTNRAKAGTGGRPPHTHHRQGWRSPTVRPAPPHHPSSIMPPRLAPHERRIPHCPPSP
eukprot:1930920-Prymnesium_polylepis.1